MTEEAATSKRSLKGYISRSFIIPELEKRATPDGLFFKRNENKTQIVLSGAKYLYDYSDSDHPELDIGYIEIPEVLQDL